MQKKLKITDYMLLSKEDRQKHIDLTTECEYYYYIKEYNHKGTIKQIGDLYTPSKQMAKAREKLLEYLNIEEFGGKDIHVCHKCQNCSTSNKVCINPLHLYYGTPSENALDKPEDLRKENSLKAWNSMTEQEKFEASSKGGKVGGKISGKSHYENGTGLFSMTEEKKLERNIKGGKSSYENGTGLFSMTEQQKRERSIKSGSNPNGAFNKKVECPYCGKIGQLAAMKTWHFDKCKFKH